MNPTEHIDAKKKDIWVSVKKKPQKQVNNKLAFTGWIETQLEVNARCYYDFNVITLEVEVFMAYFYCIQQSKKQLKKI